MNLKVDDLKIRNDQIGNEIWDNFWNKILYSVKYQIWDFVEDKAWNHIRIEVRDQISSAIKKRINYEA